MNFLYTMGESGGGYRSSLRQEQWHSGSPGRMLRVLRRARKQGAATTVLAAFGKEFERNGRLSLEGCGTAGPTEDGNAGFELYAFDKEQEARL